MITRIVSHEWTGELQSSVVLELVPNIHFAVVSGEKCSSDCARRIDRLNIYMSGQSPNTTPVVVDIYAAEKLPPTSTFESIVVERTTNTDAERDARGSNDKYEEGLSPWRFLKSVLFVDEESVERELPTAFGPRGCFSNAHNVSWTRSRVRLTAQAPLEITPPTKFLKLDMKGVLTCINEVQSAANELTGPQTGALVHVNRRRGDSGGGTVENTCTRTIEPQDEPPTVLATFSPSRSLFGNVVEAQFLNPVSERIHVKKPKSGEVMPSSRRISVELTPWKASTYSGCAVTDDGINKSSTSGHILENRGQKIVRRQAIVESFDRHIVAVRIEERLDFPSDCSGAREASVIVSDPLLSPIPPSTETPYSPSYRGRCSPTAVPKIHTGSGSGSGLLVGRNASMIFPRERVNRSYNHTLSDQKFDRMPPSQLAAYNSGEVITPAKDEAVRVLQLRKIVAERKMVLSSLLGDASEKEAALSKEVEQLGALLSVRYKAHLAERERYLENQKRLLKALKAAGY